MQSFLRGKQSAMFIKMFVLDTLIANTDRHHSNWGLLWKTLASDDDYAVRTLFPAPAFDNGTSLGHERLEEKLDGILADQSWFQRHATSSGARHHIRFHPDDTKGAPMLELVPRLLNSFPEILPDVHACVTFRDKDIIEVISSLCEFDTPVPLSKKRAAFICKMVCSRRDMLLEILEQNEKA